MDPEALRHPVLPLGRFELRHVLALILERLNLCGAKLELRITSDLGITELHARHLKGAGPTNVLAFPANEPHCTRVDALGGVVISADAVVREARLFRQATREYFVRLLTHALLHLAGFAHGPDMDELTESLLERFRAENRETA